MTRVRVDRPPISASALTAVLLLVAGCSSSIEQALRADLISLEQRIAELERTTGRQQAQLTELDEDVLLLEDRVEAHRLSLERRGVMATRARTELPSYRPPTAEPDYAYMSELPVERLAPVPAQYDERAEEDLEELVITNDTLERFVQENGGVPVTRTVPAQQSPYAPVVLGDRLPTGVSPEPRPESRQSAPQQSGSVEMYEASLQQFNAGNYEAALSGFAAFLADSPDRDYADNAYYWIGECHYARGDYPAALASFERVVQDYPDGNKVPDSLLKIALTYEQLENPEEASEVLAALVASYPQSDAARRASQRLAELN